MGLGDQIALGGAIVYLSNQQPIMIPVQPHYQRTLETMFDHHKRVKFCSSTDIMLPHIRAMPSINAQPHVPFGNGVDHFKHIYRDLLQLDYEIRWSYSPILGNRWRHTNQVPYPSVPYAFVHDDTSRRFGINEWWINASLEEVIRPQNGWTILQYCDLIEHAAEVHCIDSSFFHLTEQLRPQGKLFLHQYARPYTPVWCDYETRHDWQRLYNA